MTGDDDVSVEVPSSPTPSSSSDIKFYNTPKPLDDQTYQNLGMVVEDEDGEQRRYQLPDASLPRLR